MPNRMIHVRKSVKNRHEKRPQLTKYFVKIYSKLDTILWNVSTYVVDMNVQYLVLFKI